ncbi:MAG: MBL fold metallo-hydrolase [Alphaproteobacteria bacterium]|nr:MBL fold metallo-hydrolase [Alphaproteobacteria bacterium]
MKITSIPTGFFKLDGGAMHGSVPKSIWQKFNPADEHNMCTWESRAWLVETETKKILVDCGLGHKQGPDFFKHYYLSHNTSLEIELKKLDIAVSDITDVLLTHFHFDHCGGAVEYDSQHNLVPSFPNARYWCSLNQWELVLKPNPLEKPSFLAENIMPLHQQGVLNFIDEPVNYIGNHIIVHEFLTDFNVLEVNGHSRGLLVPHISFNNQEHIFCSDLIPSFAHIPVNYLMAYDTQPLICAKEKADFYQHFENLDTVLYFQHDAFIETATFTNKHGKYIGVKI